VSINSAIFYIIMSTISPAPANNDVELDYSQITENNDQDEEILLQVFSHIYNQSSELIAFGNKFGAMISTNDQMLKQCLNQLGESTENILKLI
jgi:hypothetical protein